MTSRGRKPVPSAIKKLTGNPGRRPIPDERHLTQRLTEPPPSPKHLSRIAKRHWEELAKSFVVIHMLDVKDLTLLEMMCDTYDDWYQAHEIVKKEGILYTTDNGNLIQHPAVGVKNTAKRLYLSMASEFGGSPTSRSKLGLLGPDEIDEEDLLAPYMPN